MKKEDVAGWVERMERNTECKESCPEKPDLLGLFRVGDWMEWPPNVPSNPGCSVFLCADVRCWAEADTDELWVRKWERISQPTAVFMFFGRSSHSPALGIGLWLLGLYTDFTNSTSSAESTEFQRANLLEKKGETWWSFSYCHSCFKEQALHLLDCNILVGSLQ